MSASTEDGDWLTPRGRKNSRSARAQATRTFNKFKVPNYGFVRYLEGLPSLKFCCEFSLRNEVLAIPWDKDSYEEMKGLVVTHPSMVELVAWEKVYKGVLLHVPVPLPLDPILEVPNIVKAERLTAMVNKVLTHQVLIHHKGPLPTHLDLGVWGRFKTQPYLSSPLQCFHCQGFNHIAATCQWEKKCGVCSKAHDSKDCIAILKQTTGKALRPEPKCANCSKRHHA